MISMIGVSLLQPGKIFNFMFCVLNPVLQGLTKATQPQVLEKLMDHILPNTDLCGGPVANNIREHSKKGTTYILPKPWSHTMSILPHMRLMMQIG